MAGAEKTHGEEQWRVFVLSLGIHSQGKSILDSIRVLDTFQEQIRTLQWDDGMSFPGVGKD